MTNYYSRKDFAERTLKLISQYERDMFRYDFNEQYNHTLLINCLLGLIVFPKERFLTHIPNERLLSSLREEMGINNSIINPQYQTIRDLIIAMRHSIAHSSIDFNSQDENFLIDTITFRENENDNDVIATFIPNELVNFVRYYGNWLISNIQNHGQ